MIQMIDVQKYIPPADDTDIGSKHVGVKNKDTTNVE